MLRWKTALTLASTTGHDDLAALARRNTRGHDDVYARTPEGWRFKTRTFVASATAAPGPAQPGQQ
jgi:hypothetical protein